MSRTTRITLRRALGRPRLTMAMLDHLQINNAHPGLLARLPRHYKVQRRLRVPRWQALLVAWRLARP